MTATTLPPTVAGAAGASWRDAAAGARAMVPYVIGILPFALVIGVAVVETRIPNAAGWATSLLLFGGSSQLAAIAMIDSGASALAVVGAVAMVNARLLVLSATLAPSMRAQSGWFRLVAAHFVVEPTHAVVTRVDGASEPRRWRGYYAGAVATLAVGWSGATGIGMALGPVVPESWPLGFAPAALMVGMLVPALKSRPALVAAAVGGVVAVATAGLPNALNLLLGALAGMTAGALADRRAR